MRGPHCGPERRRRVWGLRLRRRRRGRLGSAGAGAAPRVASGADDPYEARRAAEPEHRRQGRVDGKRRRGDKCFAAKGRRMVCS